MSETLRGVFLGPAAHIGQFPGHRRLSRSSLVHRLREVLRVMVAPPTEPSAAYQQYKCDLTHQRSTLADCMLLGFQGRSVCDFAV